MFALPVQPAFVLYVLHTSRCKNTLGRYQSPILPFETVDLFLQEFGEFLSRDGRHDLWLHLPESKATLAWDRDNLIHGYGPVDLFCEVLEREGLRRDVNGSLPVPHVHMYHASYDDAEARILSYFAWTWSPLQPADVQF
jgi:hypothetical protein